MNSHINREKGEIARTSTTCKAFQKTTKRLWLWFEDEWNVWYRARDRQATFLLEEVYNLKRSVRQAARHVLRNSNSMHAAA